MDTKKILSTIGIFAWFLLFNFLCTAQISSDTIRVIEKKAGIHHYYIEEQFLNMNLMMDLTKENYNSYKLMQKGYSLRTVSRCLYLTGGAVSGLTLGYFIQGSIRNNLKTEIFLPLLGASVGFFICGGVFELFANKHILEGVKIYNKSLKQNKTININLGFSPTEMNLKLNF